METSVVISLHKDALDQCVSHRIMLVDLYSSPKQEKLKQRRAFSLVAYGYFGVGSPDLRFLIGDQHNRIFDPPAAPEAKESAVCYFAYPYRRNYDRCRTVYYLDIRLYFRSLGILILKILLGTRLMNGRTNCFSRNEESCK